VVSIKRSRDLHVLHENPVLAIGVDHADGGSASAGPRGLVDEREAVARGGGKGGRDIVHAKGEMMQTLAPSLYESTYIRLWRQRLEQLDPRRTGAEERNANVGEALIALKVQTEAALEVRPGRVDGTDCPPKVVDGGRFSGPAQQSRSNRKRPSTGRY
jgi:hypothetical protein